jgi:hypothetical protein
LSQLKITTLFDDESIRKNITDLYQIFLFGLVYGGNHCLSYIYFHNLNKPLLHRITSKASGNLGVKSSLFRENILALSKVKFCVFSK